MKKFNLAYPSLYTSADTLSISAQKWYKSIIAFHLILLISATLTFSIFRDFTIGRIISIFLISVSFTLNIIIVLNDKSSDWYNARAIAESVKTLTWRFIMKSEPFNAKDKLSRDRFITVLKQLLSQNRNLTEKMKSEFDSHNAITDSMNKIRALDFKHRKEIYLEKRIRDQLNWYAGKTQKFNKTGKMWYCAFFISNLILFIAGLLYIFYQNLHSVFFDVLPTLITSILSWIQIQRYRELSSAYNLTAHEITLIRGAIYDVKNDKSFSNFVSDAENAFSREHTQWLARKDI